MGRVEDAVETFKKTFSCSQAVFSAFSPGLGVDRETALRVAGAFGGGMARMGEVCGAVTGALMVIGLKYGKVKAEDEEAKEKTYRLTQEFARKFRAKHGALRCPDLIGCDLATPEGAAAFKEKNLIETVCVGLVRDGAAMLEEVLRESE